MDNINEPISRLSHEELQKQINRLEKQVEELKTKQVEWCLPKLIARDTIEKFNNSGSWELDLINNKYTWSKNYCLLLGYKEKINKPDEQLFLSHVYPDDLEMVKTAIQKSMEEAMQIELEFRYVQQNGTIRFAHSSVQYIVDKKNNIKTILGLFEDITERIRKEIDLKESQQKFKSLFDNIEEGVALHEMIFDENNNVVDFIWVDVNSKYEELTQFKRDGLIGKKGRDVIPGIEKKWYDLYVEVVLTGIPQTVTNYSDYLGKYWEVKAFRPYEGHFAVALTDVTEKVKAESLLANNEAKYRALYEHAPLSYQSLDSDGRFVDINPTWLSTLGYEREEVIGKYYADFLHPDWKNNFETNFSAFKKRGCVSDVHFKIRHKKGYYRDISFEGCVGTHPDGSFKQTYCVFKDITENKLIEDALIKNQYYLSKAQEMGQIGAWELDLITNKLVWTKQNYKNFGVEIGASLTYEVFLNSIHPEDRDYVDNKWTAALEGEKYDIEHRVISGGKVKWLREKADIKFDENRTAVSAVGFSQDITSFKQSEQEIKKQGEYLRNLHDNAPISFYLVEVRNSQFVFVYQNEQARKNLNLKDKYIIGKELKAFFPTLLDNEGVEHLRTNFEWCIENRKVLSERTALKVRNKTYWWETSYSPLYSGSGEVDRIIVSGVSIDKQVEIESELKRSESIQRKMISNIGDVVAIIDENGINRYKSLNVKKHFGWDAAELIGKSTFDKVHPDDIAGAKEILHSLAKVPGITETKELRYLSKNGDYRWIHMTITNLNHDPEIKGFLANYHDTTKLKISSDATKMLADQFSAVSGHEFFDNVCEYLTKKLTIDIAFIGQLVENKKEVKVISGVVNGKPIENFTYSLYQTPCWNVFEGDVCFFPSGIQHLYPNDILLMEMGIESYMGIPIKNKVGEIFGILVLLHREPVRDNEMYINLLHIFSSRIASELERLNYESELLLAKTIAEESEQKFRALYDDSPDMYVSVSLENTEIILCNNTFLKKTGYVRDEIIGASVFKVYHQDSIKDAKETFKQFAKTGFIENKELILVKKNGEKIDVSLNVTSIKDKNGRILYSMSSWRDVSARIKLRKKLQRDRRLLNETGRLAKIGGWELDVETMTSYFSQETKQIYGIPIDATPSEGIDGIKYYPKEAQKKLHKLIQDAIEKGKPYDAEFPFVNEKREHLWIRTMGIPEQTKGKVTRLYGIFQDITEMKKAENELIGAKKIVEQSEQKYRSIITAMMNAFALHEMIFDKNGTPVDYRFLEVNPAWENTVGIKKEVVLGKTIKELMPDIEKRWIEVFGRIVSSGIPEEFEEFNKATRKYYHVYAYTPKPGKFAVFFNDVTERKASNEKILLNEKRLNALVELSRMTDKPDEFIYNFTLNKAIELTQSKIGFLGFVNDHESEVDIYKWSDSAMKECAVGDVNMKFIVEEAGVWGDVVRQRKALLLNDYSHSVPNKNEMPVRHVQIKNYSSIPAFQEDKITAIISVANKDGDYSQTDINQVTLLLNGMYRFLNQRKEKEELIKAKQKAEESDRLKSAFLSNMSHEIRTPMNGILGFTELLQDSDLSVENQKEFIAIIRESCDRLLNTVNDIIEISKIESGEINTTKFEVDLIGYLDALITFFKPEAAKKDLEFIVQNEIDGNELVVTTDKNKINSILSNLIKNAIKYTNEGTIQVGFKIKNKQILFSCEDTGIGIPENRKKAIFNRFEQADIEDTKVYEGSGLGLAIVKSYVEMLGGTIWVESEEGKGSVFCVSLPHDTEEKNEPIFSQDVKLTNFGLDNIRVLIVEDDEVSLMHLQAVLKGITKNICTAQNGIEAVEAIKNNSNIDVVLMDLKMPKMDGFEATRQIRKINKNVVIIAQTAFAFEEDKQKALNAGCRDYISKPIRSDKLIEVVSKCFQHLA